jgi:hypothetical protein
MFVEVFLQFLKNYNENIKNHSKIFNIKTWAQLCSTQTMTTWNVECGMWGDV